MKGWWGLVEGTISNTIDSRVILIIDLTKDTSDDPFILVVKHAMK